MASGDGHGLAQLTHANDALLAGIEMLPPDNFWFDGAEGTKVEAMIIKPPHFVATKKYPTLVLLHGGPQTMWSNAWGYRWNAQVFSGAGVCDPDDQPARLDRLRAKIHRRDHQ